MEKIEERIIAKEEQIKSKKNQIENTQKRLGKQRRQLRDFEDDLQQLEMEKLLLAVEAKGMDIDSAVEFIKNKANNQNNDNLHQGNHQHHRN